jgi:hypothetical protein
MRTRLICITKFVLSSNYTFKLAALFICPALRIALISGFMSRRATGCDQKIAPEKRDSVVDSHLYPRGCTVSYISFIPFFESPCLWSLDTYRWSETTSILLSHNRFDRSGRSSFRAPIEQNEVLVKPPFGVSSVFRASQRIVLCPCVPDAAR